MSVTFLFFATYALVCAFFVRYIDRDFVSRNGEK